MEKGKIKKAPGKRKGSWSKELETKVREEWVGKLGSEGEREVRGAKELHKLGMEISKNVRKKIRESGLMRSVKKS